MKIKTNRDMAFAGKHCKKGTVVEVSDQDGNYLVNGGHASKATDKKATDKKATDKKADK